MDDDLFFTPDERILVRRQVTIGFCCFPIANDSAKANNGNGVQPVSILKMGRKRKSVFPERTASAESEALDALNVQMRRKGNAARIIEASIESEAKKRRRQEAPLSSAWKQSG